MTTQETDRVDTPPRRAASTRSAAKAYQRRVKRTEALTGGRLTRTGSPIAAALTRVPFVALIILLLAGGIVGVLWLNTMSDAAGMRASQSRLAQETATTSIQQASRAIAHGNDPAQLARAAQAQGMVPPGDQAMLNIDKNGNGTVIGTPTPVAAPTTSAPTTSVPTTSVPTTSVPTTSVPTTSVPTTSAPATAKSPAGTSAAVPPPVTKAPAKTAGTAKAAGAARTTTGAARTTGAAKTTAPARTAGAANPTSAARSAAPKTTPQTTPKAGPMTTSANRSRQAPATTGAGR